MCTQIRLGHSWSDKKIVIELNKLLIYDLEVGLVIKHGQLGARKHGHENTTRQDMETRQILKN